MTLNYEEALLLDHNAPVRTFDGKYGLLIRTLEEAAGVQVPGESEIRWVPWDNLTSSNGALIEIKPSIPGTELIEYTEDITCFGDDRKHTAITGYYLTPDL